ncbi:GIY-YIG nuclease family protein [Paenibacillus agricola]|nr:GIY-YIG nuclease family protein [Paenibacillus agricola]
MDNPYMDDYSCYFCMKGESVDSIAIQNSITKLLKGKEDSECIYLLCVKDERNYIPIYIGKSKTPVTRWNSHIKNLNIGKSSYSKWKIYLLDNNRANYDCILMVIPEVAISEPPIKGFPKTIGSIEYQLVSLASDAYPDTLLNKEGNRR